MHPLHPAVPDGIQATSERLDTQVREGEPHLAILSIWGYSDATFVRVLIEEHDAEAIANAINAIKPQKPRRSGA